MERRKKRRNKETLVRPTTTTLTTKPLFPPDEPHSEYSVWLMSVNDCLPQSETYTGYDLRVVTRRLRFSERLQIFIASDPHSHWLQSNSKRSPSWLETNRHMAALRPATACKTRTIHGRSTHFVAFNRHHSRSLQSSTHGSSIWRFPTS
jgi:hypothetical protein